MKPRILVFIPAYRCEAQICRVLKQFDVHVQQWIDTVMVVDNQSPDQTLELAIECGKEVLTHCNFIAWRNDDNYGLGGSHKAAFSTQLNRGSTTSSYCTEMIRPTSMISFLNWRQMLI